MRKFIRGILVGAGVLVGLVIILAVAVGVFFDVNRYKPQIEAEVAKTTGMSLKIKGPASLRIFPRVRIAAKDVHLSNRGSELFAAGEVRVAPKLFPFLFHHELIVEQVSLDAPKIQIVKGRDGRFNYESTLAPKKAPRGAAGQKAGGTGPGQIGSLRVSNGQLTYLDQGTGQKTRLDGVDVDLSGIAWGTPGSGPQASAQLMRSMSFHGNFAAKSLQSGRIAATDLKSQIRDDHGVVRLDPTEASVFGGQLTGKAQIDLRHASPKLQLAEKLTHLDLSQVPSIGKDRISGFADGSLNLAASGKDSNTITRSANGEFSLHSKNITLNGIDVDGLLDKLKSAPGSELSGLGSSLVSGLLGRAAGQAAGVAAGASQSHTAIRDLSSDWKISNGIATTKDVAFSTPKSIVAFKGDIDLVAQTYGKFTVAVVDSKGCAQRQIGITGPLKKPRPTPESLASGVTGAEREALESKVKSGIAGALGLKESEKKPQSQPNAGAKCDQFYTGSVLHAA